MSRDRQEKYPQRARVSERLNPAETLPRLSEWSNKHVLSHLSNSRSARRLVGENMKKLGSLFLQQKSKHTDADTVIGDIEDIEYSEDDLATVVDETRLLTRTVGDDDLPWISRQRVADSVTEIVCNEAFKPDSAGRRAAREEVGEWIAKISEENPPE